MNNTIEELYVELNHLDNAEYIITRAVKCCADVLGTAAAQEPDKQMQRRTALSEMAHRLRLATGTRTTHSQVDAVGQRGSNPT